MAVQIPPELQTPEVLLRAMGSVMAGDTRTPAQKLLDFLLGGNPAERMGGVAPMRIGVMPGREKIASDIIKRGLKEPWFHGTPNPKGILKQYPPEQLQRLAEQGITFEPSFSPSVIGMEHGLRLGEPAGVSLTRSPEVARKFGDVLRIGVDIPPSSVGQFVDPEMQRLLREGFETASQIPSFPPGPMTVSQFLSKTGNLPQMVNKETVASFNQAMSDYLRKQGVEAIAYNPRRWAEYEMRVLDPSKAVPLGKIPLKGALTSAPPGSDPDIQTLYRYLYGRGPKVIDKTGVAINPYPGLINKLEGQFQAAPTFPVRLRDVLGIAGAD